MSCMGEVDRCYGSQHESRKVNMILRIKTVKPKIQQVPWGQWYNYNYITHGSFSVAQDELSTLLTHLKSIQIESENERWWRLTCEAARPQRPTVPLLRGRWPECPSKRLQRDWTDIFKRSVKVDGCGDFEFKSTRVYNDSTKVFLKCYSYCKLHPNCCYRLVLNTRPVDDCDILIMKPNV